MTDLSQIGINTMEGYISTFNKNYGMIEYHDVLDTLERGSIVRYTQHLRELGGKFINEADYIIIWWQELIVVSYILSE